MYWVRTGLPPNAVPPRPIVYRQSTDQGKTWSQPVDIDPGNVGAGHPPLLASDPNDRGIDRSKGVWSNNVDSKFNVGVAATDKEAFFAWQDARNALGETGSQDIYTSSVPLAPETVGDYDSGIPGWTLVLTGVFGLGLGVVVAWLLFRRQTAGVAPRGEPART